MELYNLQTKTEHTYAIRIDDHQIDYLLQREFHYINVENNFLKMLYYQ